MSTCHGRNPTQSARHDGTDRAPKPVPIPRGSDVGPASKHRTPVLPSSIRSVCSVSSHHATTAKAPPCHWRFPHLSSTPREPSTHRYPAPSTTKTHHTIRTAGSQKSELLASTVATFTVSVLKSRQAKTAQRQIRDTSMMRTMMRDI